MTEFFEWWMGDYALSGWVARTLTIVILGLVVDIALGGTVNRREGK